VGAGIAGLSAGIYARQSGFDVTILEMHTIPGGNSTSWKRGGYPEGGSLSMALRMAKRYESLGGKIKYNKRVQRVLVKDGKNAYKYQTSNEYLCLFRH